MTAPEKPLIYKAQGVTRKDVENNTVPAQKARAAMGEAPEDVAAKRVVPRHAAKAPAKAPPQ